MKSSKCFAPWLLVKIIADFGSTSNALNHMNRVRAN